MKAFDVFDPRAFLSRRLSDFSNPSHFSREGGPDSQFSGPPESGDSSGSEPQKSENRRVPPAKAANPAKAGDELTAWLVDSRILACDVWIAETTMDAEVLEAENNGRPVFTLAEALDGLVPMIRADLETLEKLKRAVLLVKRTMPGARLRDVRRLQA